MNETFQMERKREYILALNKLHESLDLLNKYQSHFYTAKPFRHTFAESLDIFEQDLEAEIDLQMDKLNELEVQLYHMVDLNENKE